jgi:uncharacterized protein (DUF2267 family)
MRDQFNRTQEFDSGRYRESVVVGRGKPRTMNFEAYAAEGNRFIREVAFEMNADRDRAARVTRAVLHALRDRLPADDGVQFGQGLPMAIKAVYFDQYDISKTPVVIRRPNQFLDFIAYKAGMSSVIDFPDRESAEEGLRAVFRVLERHMSFGQVEQIKHMLNREIMEMING